MFKQVFFMIMTGMLAVVVTGPVQATPFKDIARPEMIDQAVAGSELPADR